MLMSHARRAAAAVLTRGRVEPIANEIYTELSNGRTQASVERIDRIVSHAIDGVPFYRELGIERFADLPVVDKGVIRGESDKFFHDGADREKLVPSSTSGSTGTPFTAYHDADKVLRHRAGLVGTYRYIGVDPYGNFVHCRPWSTSDESRGLLHSLKGHCLYAGDHPESRSAMDVASWIRRREDVVVMGYASYVEALLRAWEDRGVRWEDGAVRAVVAGSEPATPYLTTGADRLFGLTPHQRYSNMEIGMMGVTGDDPDVFQLDTSSFHVEILDETSDVPVAPGERGRVVVTDLHNRAMPFLRYDTGDLGRFPLDAEGVERRSELTGLLGRRFDVLVAGTEESPRSAHVMQVVRGTTANIDRLRQFQLRQHAVGEFTWVLNADKSSSLEGELRALLHERVGDIVRCDFEYVDGVPTLASGKRQFFVNEIPDVAELLKGSGADRR